MTPSPQPTAFPVEQLLQAEAYPHPVSDLQLMETHISWIVLTGEYAYKIKKPVNFGFVNYKTLELRLHYCDEEIRLNRRFAPGIYLGTVPIYMDSGTLRVGQEQDQDSTLPPACEYAVKMKQFSQQSIAAARLDHAEMSGACLETFGKSLAQIHERLQRADLQRVEDRQPVTDALDNFPVLLKHFDGDDRQTLLERLQAWTQSSAEQLAPAFHQRLAEGGVRRCHGDLHLKNIIQRNGELLAFDGIEFNERLQWIDVLADIAFPAMDLMARNRSDLAWRLINGWFEINGSYEFLSLFRFYMVYRALVRAKVTCLNPKNQDLTTRARHAPSSLGDAALAGPWDKYLRVARQLAFGSQPQLSITHGFSGSGKSTRALQIVASEGGIRIRSDVERHRLAAWDAERTEIPKYSSRMNDRVYDRLRSLADAGLEGGFHIIVDATFLKREARKPFEKLANDRQVEYRILDCQAPVDELRKRIARRRQDASEATLDVLERQLREQDPLTPAEQQAVVPKSDG